WNGIGLVLMEVKRYADAKNAFARAVEAEPTLAAAHYNLSFTLSQLGDFDGALRATKQALELEPYYVPQKYVLAIDLQYEDPTILITPALRTDVSGDALAGEFAFDPQSLDRLFAELTPAHVEGPAPVAEDPLALARDYVAKGLLELATAELERVRGRGVSAARAATLWGDIFSRRGLHGEALERYREARAAEPDDTAAELGEVRALLAMGQGAEAVELTARLVERLPADPEVLFARARSLHAAGDDVGAMAAIRAAQVQAPGRPDLHQLQALIAGELGDTAAALEACQVALQLDGSLVQVWYELGRLEERRENWSAARAAYERALQLLPTFVTAGLALADLARRVESPAAAIHILVDLLSADPYELEALTLLGRALLDDGRPARALEALDRVLRFDPDHAAALFYRGVALARERQFRDAVSAWDRVVQLQPTGELAAQARTRARSARDLEHIFAPTG
ncbi:MAG: tetratricopeptide repeat protein, partial [Bacillota bacterium]